MIQAASLLLLCAVSAVNSLTSDEGKDIGQQFVKEFANQVRECVSVHEGQGLSPTLRNQ
jgi:hypothetical protein